MSTEFVLKPEPKKPSDSLHEYLKYFKDIVICNGWSDARAAVIFKPLLGVGTHWLDDVPEAELQLFSKIEKALEAQQAPFREAKCGELLSVSMGRRETVYAFRARVTELVDTCFGNFANRNRQQLSRDFFVHRLATDLKSAVLATHATKLEEAVNAALMAESMRIPSRNEGQWSKEKPQEVNLNCHFCKKSGHFIAECPERKDWRRDWRDKTTQKKTLGKPDYSVSSVYNTEICSRSLVPVSLGSGEVQHWLIDCGSQTSCLPTAMYSPDLPKSNFLKLRAVNGGPIDVKGEKTMNFCIGSASLQHTFPVVEMTGQPIIGIDILDKIGAVIDFQSGTLRLKSGEMVKLLKESIVPIASQRVFNKQHVETFSPVMSAKIEGSSWCSGSINESVEDGSIDSEWFIDIARIEPESMVTIHDLIPEVVNAENDCTTRIDKVINSNFPSLGILLDEYDELFRMDQGGSIGEHAILTDAACSPICQRPYRIPKVYEEKVSEKIYELLQGGYIQESKSAWCSPLVVVRKKGTDDIRICVDVRKLNNATTPDRFPVPIVEDLLQEARGSVFSVLDCNQAYYQVSLRPEDYEKTAFQFKGRLYEFKVMCFGLRNAPACWSRLIKNTLGHLSFVKVFLDDILVHSSNNDEHVEHLKQVFESLRKKRIRLKRKKCFFFQTEVEYLGFLLSEDGVLPTTNKVECISKFPRPQTQKELKRFLGMVGYYRSHIKNFGTIAVELQKLLKKSAKKQFIWSVLAEKAFISLKDKLVCAPVRVIPNFSKTFIVTCDASDIGVGVTLEQDGRLVEAISRGFDGTQGRWPAIEKEAFAIIFALKKWRHILLGRPFSLRTDCKALTWLRQRKNCLGKIGRWNLAIQEFEFDCEHIPGKQNLVSDCLSRAQCASISAERWVHESKSDGNFKELAKSKDFRWNNGLLLEDSEKGLKIVVPKSLIKELLEAYHEDKFGGHQGVTKTLSRLQQNYLWKNMKKDVTDMCQKCHLCAVCKDYGKQSKTPMIAIPTDHLFPFQKCGLDILGPLPTAEDGSRYIVVLQDYFSKWPVVGALEAINSKNICKWMEDQVFCSFGFPEELITDQGTQLTSKEFEDFLKRNGIFHRKTAPFHPQTDGLVERFNRTLVNSLRCYVQEHPEEWTRFLQPVTFAYRAAKHASTGYSPFELLQVRQPRMGIDIKPPRPSVATQEQLIEEAQQLMERMRGDARKRLQAASQKQTSGYNLRNKTASHSIKVGDEVYWRRPPPLSPGSKKLKPPWQGPYTVIRKIGEKNLELQGGNGVTTTVNVDQVKRSQTKKTNATLRKRGRPKKL